MHFRKPTFPLFFRRLNRKGSGTESPSGQGSAAEGASDGAGTSGKWGFKRPASPGLRWKRKFTVYTWFIDGFLFKIVYVLEAIVLVFTLCFFYLCCGKLISSQSDPLLAKEIFDLASHQPNFRHSYAAWHTLILKLGRSGHFSLMESLLSSLKSQSYSISPSLFSQIIKIYGDAGLPDEAQKMFFTILKFNMKPLPKHLNRILEILVDHRNFLRPALDLLKSSHAYGVSANTASYNILMRAFCSSGDLSVAYSLFNQIK